MPGRGGCPRPPLPVSAPGHKQAYLIRRPLKLQDYVWLRAGHIWSVWQRRRAGDGQHSSHGLSADPGSPPPSSHEPTCSLTVYRQLTIIQKSHPTPADRAGLLRMMRWKLELSLAAATQRFVHELLARETEPPFGICLPNAVSQ